MQQIRPDIYEKLFTSPVVEQRQGLSDSLGDTQGTDSISYQGYIYEGFQRVINASGEEELSNRQIYLRGEDAKQIRDDSLITCSGVADQRIISRKLYYGKASTVVIGVLYLP